MTEHSLPLLETPRDPRGPRVSIVMPTYQRAHQIGDSIRTLLAQTYADFELLVRDDGDGRDGTAEAVDDAAQGDPRVRYHRNESPLRMPGNLNAGIRASRGELIAVCHDHDLYEPDFLQEMVAALDAQPGAHYVHCAIHEITQDGRLVRTHVGDWNTLTPGHEWLRFMLSSLNCPVCALTLVRRESHARHGLYDPRWGFISDVELWMRLASVGDVAYVRRPLIRVRQRELGHHADVQALRLLRVTKRIQTKYLRIAYGPFESTARRARLAARVGRHIMLHHAARVKRRLLTGGTPV